MNRLYKSWNGTVAAAGCIIASISGCAGPSGVAARSVKTYDARTFFETVSYTGASFSADESRLLISSDLSGVFNVYSMPIAGGEPQMLTHSTTHATYGVAYFPRDDRFLYTRTEEGALLLWRLRIEDLLELAKQRVGRNLLPAEWSKHMPDTTLRATFPDLPTGK